MEHEIEVMKSLAFALLPTGTKRRLTHQGRSLKQQMAAKRHAMRLIDARLSLGKTALHGADGTKTTPRELYARMNLLRNHIAELQP